MTPVVSPADGEAVLVTGARGFIARHLAPILQQAGLVTLGTSRSPGAVEGFDEVYQAYLGDSLLPVLKDRRPAGYRISAMVHCALDSDSSSDILWRVNVDGTTRWLHEAKECGIGLHVFLSSLSADAEALSDYGRGKYLLEERFLAQGQVVLRMGVVIGNGGMFGRMQESLRRSPVIPLLDGGNQLIYVLGIDFLCSVIKECILDGGEDLRGRAWNVQQPRPYRLRELLAAIKADFGLRALLVPVPSRPIVIALSALERLPVLGWAKLKLPVSAANVQGLIQQGQRTFPSDYARFGHPEESLQELLARIH